MPLSQSPVTGNHVRALLSKAFNLAIGWGWVATNPVTGTRRYRIRQRETVLTPAQLQALDSACPPTPFGTLVRLLMLTGCRVSEIRTARREWVDLPRRLLLLPDSKVGQRRIVLPERACQIIAAIPNDQVWLIPGRLRGRPLVQSWDAWKRLVRAAGLPPSTRMHDLRHTFGSLGNANGLSQRQIATLLGHSDLATTARYLHGVGSDAEAAELVASVWHTHQR